MPRPRKLSDEEVTKIRLLLAEVRPTQAQIARAYGVSEGLISDIKNGKLRAEIRETSNDNSV